jgi:prephenate dehydratase
MPTVSYLGPAGTFSEDALRAAAASEPFDALPAPTVFDAISAVAERRADLALVPFENSIEGSVRATLDALAFDAPDVAIVGEHDQAVSHSLIARTDIPLDEIQVVLSHPHASAQCAHFLRRELPQAAVRAAASTADAVREVGEQSEPWAALGTRSAAAIYGCVVLREGVEDHPDNVTRFVWLAPAGDRAAPATRNAGQWKTTLWFSELGADHPGALVDALTEFSDRDVNLTRIESRPLRRGLGRYMFFIDLEGPDDDRAVAAAIEGLRAKAENVRVLGSYPVDRAGIPAG